METGSFLSRLENVKKSGMGWTARCPGHDDRQNSLSVSAGQAGVLVKCFAGCSHENIVNGLGLKMSDLFFDGGGKDNGHQPKPTAPRKPAATKATVEEAKNAIPELFKMALSEGYKLTAIYPYDGYFRVRLDHPGKGKLIRPFYKTVSGWKHGEPSFPPRGKPLYRKDEIALNPSATVWIVEGEKCADTLTSLGLIATTSGSASSADNADWTPLKDRHVVLWPDNDEPGQRYADSVEDHLTRLGCHVERIDVVALSLPVGGDVVDWLKADPSATKADIESLPLMAPTPKDNGWPEPSPLPNELLPVEPYSDALMPAALRPWISDVAERMQCPPDYVAAASVVSLAAIVGRRAGIYPKRHDDWRVIPNLFGGNIGNPSAVKSPAKAEGMAPLDKLERMARDEYENLLADYEAEKLIQGAKSEKVKDDLKNAARQGAEEKIEEIRAKLKASKQTDDGKPIQRRYKVNDATVEKLGVILEENPRGVLLDRDELIGWLDTLERPGHESDRAFYLEAWNGFGSFTYDRISRETCHIRHTCVSIFGNITPSKLARYIGDAVKGYKNDGLIQRFQVMVYPDPPAQWRIVDRAPNLQAKDQAFRTFERLDKADFVAFGGELHDDGTVYFRFDDRAQDLFYAWWSDLEQTIREPDEHVVIQEHLSKYRKLMPALALLFHLVDVADGASPGPVSVEAAQLAGAWTAHLESHARRIYGIGIHSEIKGARELLKKIEGGKVSDGFTPRDVYDKGWTSLSSADDVWGACEILEERGYLRRQVIKPSNDGGRPSVRFSIHPQALGESKP